MRLIVTGDTSAFLDSSALLIRRDSRISFKEFFAIEKFSINLASITGYLFKTATQSKQGVSGFNMVLYFLFLFTSS